MKAVRRAWRWSVVVGVVVGGCAFPRPGDVGWRVGGTITGLWDGATVSLELTVGGSSSTTSITDDGVFEFPDSVADGAYQISVRSPPGHECSVDRATGVITASDVLDLTVQCRGPRVQLALDVPSMGTFDPDAINQRFVTTILSTRATFQVSADALTAVMVADQAVSPSVWSAPIDLAPGAQTFALVVRAGAASRTYQLEVDRGAASPTQVLYAKASNGAAGDNLGSSISMSTDALVVGAPGHDDDRTDSGAAYVFTPSTADWREVAYLRSSKEFAGDGLGVVAVSGDRLVAGAPARGMAVVFRRSGDVWQQEAILNAVGGEATDGFASSVAIDGDRIVVGASLEDSATRTVDGDPANNDALSAGAAYVFERGATGWTQVAYLKPSNGDIQDQFGFAVAIRGDEVIVGAPYEGSRSVSGAEEPLDNSQPGVGAAYVFRAGPWRQVGYLKGDLVAAQFGSSIAVDAGTLVVGAPTSANNRGRAYLYRREGAIWSTAQAIVGADTDDDDSFGVALAVDRDMIVVGAKSEAGTVPGVDPPSRDDFGDSQGVVYVFHQTSTQVIQDHYIKAAVLDESDEFGSSVALVRGTLCVGAPGEDGSSRGLNGDANDDAASRSGALYCFR